MNTNELISKFFNPQRNDKNMENTFEPAPKTETGSDNRFNDNDRNGLCLTKSNRQYKKVGRWVEEVSNKRFGY